MIKHLISLCTKVYEFKQNIVTELMYTATQNTLLLQLHTGVYKLMGGC